MDLNEIIAQFLGNQKLQIHVLEGGLINSTYLVETENAKYILQKVNTTIFKNPVVIAHNHVKINQVLQENGYEKKVSEPLFTKSGDYFAESNGEYWRMQTFIEDSTTFAKVPNPEIAQEAAKFFSAFYLALNTGSAPNLQEVLPDFINFKKTISDFKSALENATEERIINAEQEIQFIQNNIEIPEKWIHLAENNLLPQRVIHADPKISNILFNDSGKSLAVIDLDTVMTSNLLYDFGDMMRSYTNLTDEDDAKIVHNFSPEIYYSVKNAFLFHLKKILTETETENLDYAAKVVVFIQAIRFLTDYLNGDVYYKTSHESQNLDRTRNQINLLHGLEKFQH